MNLLSIIQDYWLLFLVGNFPSGPLGGLVLTLTLSFFGLVLALPMSLLFALLLTSPLKRISVPTDKVIRIIRGVPLVLTIFWIYFGLPALLGHAISGAACLMLALVLYEGAFMAEIIRASLNSLPRGQHDAAQALGLTRLQAQQYILLPQALYNATPSLLNQLISMVKETSLGYVIGVQELTFASSQVNDSVLTEPVAVYGVLAAIYFVVCSFLALVIRAVEGQMQRKRSSMPSALRLRPELIRQPT